MHRIDTANNVDVLPPPDPAGTAGYFSKGDPVNGQKATYLDQDWCNSVQEEISHVVEEGGLALDKEDNTQLLAALRILLGGAVPAGTLLQYAGAAAPAGFLVCDGAAISRADYAALFTAIDVAWGVGDGVTTFNVPDFRGRTPVGVGAGAGLTARALADKAGEESHALVAGEIPAVPITGTAEADGLHSHGVTDPGHDHAVTDPGHTHPYTLSNGDSSTTPYVAADGDNTRSAETGHTSSAVTGITVQDGATGLAINDGGTHTHDVTGNTGGGGGAHNNMQPFAVVNFIIKT